MWLPGEESCVGSKTGEEFQKGHTKALKFSPSPGGKNHILEEEITSFQPK
jgi:hypothetical protein